MSSLKCSHTSYNGYECIGIPPNKKRTLNTNLCSQSSHMNDEICDSDDDILVGNDEQTPMGPYILLGIHILHHIINGTYEYEQIMNFCEIYDRNMLYKILNTEPYTLMQFLSPDKQNDKYINALYPMLRMYDQYEHNNNIDGSKNIWYKHGAYDTAKLERIYAIGYASLQSFSRAIRGALAADLYYDIDISNCFPTILLFVLNVNNFDPNKYSAIKAYVANRPT